MKKILVCLVLILGIAMASPCLAATMTFPRRDATKVDDVDKTYNPEGWIVSPNEEPVGDQTAHQLLESDIYGVVACYDQDYLRVDIQLKNPVSFEWDSFYTIEFKYDQSIVYFTYYPFTEELVYEQEKNGQIVKTETMDLLFDEPEDSAGVTSAGEVKDTDICFFIKKNKYFVGEKGKTYYLISSFSAGYVDDDHDKLVTTDQTITVLLHFVM